MVLYKLNAMECGHVKHIVMNWATTIKARTVSVCLSIDSTTLCIKAGVMEHCFFLNVFSGSVLMLVVGKKPESPMVFIWEKIWPLCHSI